MNVLAFYPTATCVFEKRHEIVFIDLLLSCGDVFPGVLIIITCETSGGFRGCINTPLFIEEQLYFLMLPSKQLTTSSFSPHVPEKKAYLTLDFPCFCLSLFSGLCHNHMFAWCYILYKATAAPKLVWFCETFVYEYICMCCL